MKNKAIEDSNKAMKADWEKEVCHIQYTLDYARDIKLPSSQSCTCMYSYSVHVKYMQCTLH